MTAFTDEDMKSVFSGILKSARDEIREISDPSELERFWFFAYEPDRSVEWNIYRFSELIDIYKRKCREWEEIHNGCACVVERVRDQYVLPKIRSFAQTVKAVPPGHVRMPSSRDEAELMLLTAERYLRDNGFIQDEA